MWIFLYRNADIYDSAHSGVDRMARPLGTSTDLYFPPSLATLLTLSRVESFMSAFHRVKSVNSQLTQSSLFSVCYGERPSELENNPALILDIFAIHLEHLGVDS